jgi:hypothetical protein
MDWPLGEVGSAIDIEDRYRTRNGSLSENAWPCPRLQQESDGRTDRIFIRIAHRNWISYVIFAYEADGM